MGAVGAWVHLAPESPFLSEAIEGYPYAVYGIGVLLAWRLRRSRVVAALLAVTVVTLLPDLFADDVRTAIPKLLGAAALPAAWLGLGLLPDRPLFSRRGLASLAVVFGSMGTALGASLLRPDPVTHFLEAPLAIPGLAWAPTPELLLPAALGGGVLTVAIRRHRPVERGLFWSLLALEAALLAGPAAVGGSAFLLAAGLILGAAVVEGSYVEAYHDELTGLPGRRALTHALERLGRTYTVAMVDVDHFKRFNDRHGHEVGDQVLRMVASRLRRASGGGRAFRYGGEEFTLLYPGMDRKEARTHLEAVRRSIGNARFVLRGPARKKKGPEARGTKGSSSSEKTLSVTVSIGIADPREPGEDPLRVLDRADEALYGAKKKGRDRVEG